MTAPILCKERSDSDRRQLIFVGHIRFEQGRPRVFTVAVWRRVKVRASRPVSIWGDELKQAMEAMK